MRTTISIDDHLLEMAKRRALERSTTLGAIVEDALRVALLGGAAPEDKAFTLVTFRGDGPLPEVDLDRTSQLLVDEDVERFGRQ